MLVYVCIAYYVILLGGQGTREGNQRGYDKKSETNLRER